MASPQRSILICYDGSETANDAVLQTAQAFPERSVIILHAWKPFAVLGYGFEGVAWPGDITEIDSSLRRIAEEIVERGRLLATEHGLRATSELIDAPRSVGNAILDRARAGDVDVIAIGTVGHSAIGRALLGSVSNTVLHNATVPVLLIHRSRPAEVESPHDDATAFAHST